MPPLPGNGPLSFLAPQRARQFLFEFVALTVFCQLALTAVADFATRTYTPTGHRLWPWAPIIGMALAQWVVLRRYVPWAMWWVPVTIAGHAVLYWTAYFAIFQMAPSLVQIDEPGSAVPTAAGGLAIALLQYPTLRGRVPSAWAWLIAVPGALVLGWLAAEVLIGVSGLSFRRFNFGTGAALLAVTAARATATAIATGVALAWLCREWLDGSPRTTRARPSSRLEFFVAWSAVYVITWSIGGNSPFGAGTPRMDDELTLVPVLFVALHAAGQLWVLYGTTVDFRRWRRATLLGVGVTVFFVLVQGPARETWVHEFLLLTRVGGLGLPLAFAQTSAFSKRSTGALWVVAAIAGWTCGYWLEAPIHPGLVAGNITAAAVLPELASRAVTTPISPSREPDTP